MYIAEFGPIHGPELGSAPAYPVTNFPCKPRYPTNFRLGHHSSGQPFTLISTQSSMERSSELKDACTTAIGHKEARYAMKITDGTGSLECVAW